MCITTKKPFPFHYVHDALADDPTDMMVGLLLQTE